MAKNLYNQDNAQYRQFVYQTLQGILNNIAALNDLSATNIKSGAKILGYTGTFSDEAVSPATAVDIAEGKIAYVNGVKIVGVAGIAEYALTVATGGTGTGAVTVGGVAYTVPVDFKAGVSAELVATADAGSHFVKWTVDGVDVSTDDTYAYSMGKAAKTITAVFDLD